VLAVASNQRGLARGLVSEATLTAIEAEIQRALAPHDVAIAAFSYCPHELDAGCDCRKPKPGMILELASELQIDLASSWMIGDSRSDVEAGRAAGTRTALITASGQGDADVSAPTLRDVAAAIGP
jgi:D-glycero-D-manno-heptose 1,7-bisphosphate phosphatase